MIMVCVSVMVHHNVWSMCANIQAEMEYIQRIWRLCADAYLDVRVIWAPRVCICRRRTTSLMRSRMRRARGRSCSCLCPCTSRVDGFIRKWRAFVPPSNPRRRAVQGDRAGPPEGEAEAGRLLAHAARPAEGLDLTADGPTKSAQV